MRCAGDQVDGLTDGLARGRGAGLNPGNRFETVRLQVLGEHHDRLAAGDEQPRHPSTEVIVDRTRSVINRVDSPDLPFRWTLNPYRGCEHGCVYCYARPDHERLGYSCGLDFETKLIAKPDAPAILIRELARPGWTGEPIVMAGVTDVYQPVERRLQITRQCLDVMARARQPVSLVTKNRLVTRDIDLLAELARHQAVCVALSITTLDAKLARAMEPRASSPADRLRAIRELSSAAVPVAVMVAPIIPGLTDREAPAILQAAAESGATAASYVLLRLPHQVKALFLDWLERTMPGRAKHITSLLRQARGGELYDARWGARGRGEGPIATQIGQLFRVAARRHGLTGGWPRLCSDAFRAPSPDGQMALFA